MVLLLLLFANSDCCALSLDYRREPKAPWIDYYIQGVGAGYLWANLELGKDGLPPLYCPPDKLYLNLKNYLDILNAELEQSDIGKLPHAPIELILLRGLKRTFPCD